MYLPVYMYDYYVVYVLHLWHSDGLGDDVLRGWGTTPLASTSKTTCEVNRGPLLDVEVAELFLDDENAGQRLALEGQDLLLCGDTRLFPDLVLRLIDVVVSPDIQGDRLARDGLHEDLELVLSTKYGLFHVVDVQDGLLHGLAVVKELHLIVYYLVVFNGVVVGVVDSILVVIGGK